MKVRMILSLSLCFAFTISSIPQHHKIEKNTLDITNRVLSNGPRLLHIWCSIGE